MSLLKPDRARGLLRLPLGTSGKPRRQGRRAPVFRFETLEGRVLLAVAPTPPPVARPDSYSTTEGNFLSVSVPGVQSNDSSPTGQALTSTVVSGTAHGTIVLRANGSFVYNPDAGFVGTDTFAYQDFDGNNYSNTTLVTFTVTPKATQPSPPSVVNLQRFGYHAQPTAFVLTFNEALDPASARNVANYRLTPLGQPGASIAIASAVYNPSNQTVTLYTVRPVYFYREYVLAINGASSTGLKGLNGVPLDGLGNGTPGSNYSRTFGGEILAGTDFGFVPRPFTAAQASAQDAAINALANRTSQRSTNRS